MKQEEYASEAFLLWQKCSLGGADCVCMCVHLFVTHSLLPSLPPLPSPRGCSAVLLENRRNADAIYIKGMCIMRQGNPEKAVDYFKQALQFDPDHKTSLAAFRVCVCAHVQTALYVTQP